MKSSLPCDKKKKICVPFLTTTGLRNRDGLQKLGCELKCVRQRSDGFLKRREEKEEGGSSELTYSSVSHSGRGSTRGILLPSAADQSSNRGRVITSLKMRFRTMRERKVKLYIFTRLRQESCVIESASLSFFSLLIMELAPVAIFHASVIVGNVKMGVKEGMGRGSKCSIAPGYQRCLTVFSVSVQWRSIFIYT